MNYDDHADFNKYRLPHEATKEFANARAAVFDKANADFAGGTRDGIFYLTIIGLLSLLVITVT
jgi:hypothetical protein